ncbi:fimbrial biogenesis chaperone [Paraburkholderia acidicola]|nr:fimbria/pilus periplasmic chaperone [Paraburkholderia acidicola]
MNMFRSPYKLLAIAVLMARSVSAQADVQVEGTRVVFPAADQEVTLQMTNRGKVPSLVQAWIDKGDQAKSPDAIDVPFVMTPDVFRVEPGKGQTLRILYTGGALPVDRESLLWLNILDVPPKSGAGDEENQIQLAIRTRIKLMYRPSELPGRAEDAPATVSWSVVDKGAQHVSVKATNPTPYVVNLGRIVLNIDGKKFDAGSGYVLPGQSADFPLAESDHPPARAGKVDYVSIDDWGAARTGSADAVLIKSSR